MDVPARVYHISGDLSRGFPKKVEESSRAKKGSRLGKEHMKKPNLLP